MIIGIPRERKQGETRVGITPQNAQFLSSNGHQVLIEGDAGRGSDFLDSAYKEAGAEVVGSLEEVWGRAELILKVKEPAPEEFSLMRPGLAVFSFLHPAADAVMTKALVEHEVTGIDYDLVRDASGALPILRPMSEIAGKLALQVGATALQSNNSGRGVLLSGLSGVEPGKVVVVGAGVAGSAAAHLAYSNGARVVVFDRAEQRLLPFRSLGSSRIKPIIFDSAILAEEITDCDLLIGAVLVAGALAPRLLTREMVQAMPRGSVIVDICIDQGGFSETSRLTSIAQPTFIEHGVVHYCVPNMPALVPRSATTALNAATLPYLKTLCDLGIEQALVHDKALGEAVATYRGKVTNAKIAQALGYDYTPFSH